MGPTLARAPLGCALLAAAVLGLSTAPAAQGVRTLDPFYQGESARRDFYGGLAVSGEVAYRTADLMRPASGPTAADDVALSVQLDYALLPQVDVAAVVDLSGGIGRGPMGLSWVVVKPYWFNEATDYAVRLAVDPASEGGLGFRQTDVAFLSTTTYGPTLTSDFAIGLRRVRSGYTLDPEADLAGDLLGLPFDGPGGATAALRATGERVRVIGRELHASWGYNVLFDPGGSHVALALLAEAGDYRLLPTGPDGAAGGEQRVRSGIGWFRAGVEWSRASYVLGPYFSIPVVTWADVQGEPVRYGPRPDRTRFGLRLMLR